MMKACSSTPIPRFCLASSSTRSGTSRRRWATEATRNSRISGLKRSPEHPVLNYHFGKLIADRIVSRGRVALAKAGQPPRLSPDMA